MIMIDTPRHIAPVFKKHGLDPAALLTETLDIAKEAGKILMHYYNGGDDINIEIKQDDSPVTAADKASSALIESRLASLTPQVTVVSEENDADPSAEQPYWSIDPLDGTKLFINKKDSFTVHIALMLEGRPALGVVHCPALNETYFSYEGLTASYKQEGDNAPQKIKTRSNPDQKQLKVYFDSVHAKIETYMAARPGALVRGLNLTDKPDPSRPGPHNLIVAQGRYDLHVKTGKDINFQKSSGHSWDNAADYIIVKNARGLMVQLDREADGGIKAQPLKFNTVRGKMPAYMTFGDQELCCKVFPELKHRGPKGPKHSM